jgi:hypothetical protein
VTAGASTADVGALVTAALLTSAAEAAATGAPVDELFEEVQAAAASRAIETPATAARLPQVAIRTVTLMRFSSAGVAGLPGAESGCTEPPPMAQSDRYTGQTRQPSSMLPVPGTFIDELSAVCWL